MAFKEIKAEELTWNPFTQIGKGWFLVTAGDEKASNTMTVSWGAWRMVGQGRSDHLYPAEPLHEGIHRCERDLHHLIAPGKL